MSWQPGIYDRKLTLQVSERVQTASGAFTYTWSNLKTVAARRINDTGNESVLADRRENNYSVTWEIPYCYDVFPNMRAVYRNEVYNIMSVIEIGRKEKMRLETQFIQTHYGS